MVVVEKFSLVARESQALAASPEGGEAVASSWRVIIAPGGHEHGERA
jgi:hypothetical protein